MNIFKKISCWWNGRCTKCGMKLDYIWGASQCPQWVNHEKWSRKKDADWKRKMGCPDECIENPNKKFV